MQFPAFLQPTLAAALLLLLPWAASAAPAQAQASATAATAGTVGNAAPAAACPALLQHTVLRLQDEAPQSLCQYSGKVLLVVNTASFCGFTGQYEGLEALHKRFQAKGLVVLGFPSNDFSQETGDNKQIAAFCSNTFGVKFPMFTKTGVTGDAASPLYRQLAQQTGKAPQWNFYKYLVGRDGRVLQSYSSMTGPDNAGLVRAVEQALAQPVPAGMAHSTARSTP
ncbi:MAG: glutathione peroxidase [Giesbergeria sp.]|nr:glutathione peroxidase [Giesbergeria sp.]MBP8091415.1 glutathione peroxidase [Giesbergeria sp.]